MFYFRLWITPGGFKFEPMEKLKKINFKALLQDIQSVRSVDEFKSIIRRPNTVISKYSNRVKAKVNTKPNTVSGQRMKIQ